jgi:hypothetical protein
VAKARATKKTKLRGDLGTNVRVWVHYFPQKCIFVPLHVLTLNRQWRMQAQAKWQENSFSFTRANPSTGIPAACSFIPHCVPMPVHPPPTVGAGPTERYFARPDPSTAVPVAHAPPSGVPGCALVHRPATLPRPTFTPLPITSLGLGYEGHSQLYNFRAEIMHGNALSHTHLSRGPLFFLSGTCLRYTCFMFVSLHYLF